MVYTKVITCICKHCLKDLCWRSLFLLPNTAGRANEKHLSSQPVEDLHWGNKPHWLLEVSKHGKDQDL